MPSRYTYGNSGLRRVMCFLTPVASADIQSRIELVELADLSAANPAEPATNRSTMSAKPAKPGQQPYRPQRGGWLDGSAADSAQPECRGAGHAVSVAHF